MKVLCFIVLLVSGVRGFSNMGKKFSIPFPPNYYGDQNGECELNFVSDEYTEVTITMSRTGQIFVATVNPENGYRLTFDCEERGSSGIEDKAIVVTSEHPIAVYLWTERYKDGDTVTIFPEDDHSAANYEYYLVSFPGSPCTQYYTHLSTTYGIASFDKPVDIEVFDSVSGTLPIDSFTLEPYHTYTNSSICYYSYDFTGWKIRTNQPVTVISGSLRTNQGDCGSDDGLTSVVDSRFLDKEYIIPPIERPKSATDSSNKRIVVAALDQNTTAVIVDKNNQVIAQQILNAGDKMQYFTKHDIQYGGLDAHIVRCSSNCIAFGHVDCVYSTDGKYLFHQPSTRRGTTKCISKRIYNNGRMSIISNTKSVNVNGYYIRDDHWTEMSGLGIYYATFYVEEDFKYTVDTTDNNGSFQVYLHSQFGTSSPYMWGGDLVGVGDTPMAENYVLSEDFIENHRQHI